MTELLSNISAWFESLGVSPLVGGFLFGVLVGFLLRSAGRAKDQAADPNAPQFVAGTRTISINGQSRDVPEQVFYEIDAGRKINAIKALREAVPMGLKEAKDLVEEIAARPKV